MAHVSSDAASFAASESPALPAVPTLSQLAQQSAELLLKQSSTAETSQGVPRLPDPGSVVEEPALSESELYQAFALAQAARCAVASKD